MIADRENFPTHWRRCEQWCYSARQRGPFVSHHHREGWRTYAHTHIYAYTVHSGMATNTHKSTHSTQLHYCVNSIPKSDTCQSTSAAEHLCM